MLYISTHIIFTMKLQLLFILLLLHSVAFAQRVCTVYQYATGEENKKKKVQTSYYNELGKLTKEVVRGYYVFLDNTNTMYCQREDGIYDYYYFDDTQLIKTVVTNTDDLTGMPIDSSKTFYYYDSITNRLERETSVKHLKKREPGKKPGSFRNTINYTYDNGSRIAEKAGAYGANTREYLIYDQVGRLLGDSIRSCTMNDDFCIITKYEYYGNEYREYSWMCDRKHPLINVYKKDEQGRVVELALWMHKEDFDGGGCKSNMPTNWGAFLNNDLSKYKQFEKILTKYNAEGKIAETLYFYDGKHTTTHEYVYE